MLFCARRRNYVQFLPSVPCKWHTLPPPVMQPENGRITLARNTDNWVFRWHSRCIFVKCKWLCIVHHALQQLSGFRMHRSGYNLTQNNIKWHMKTGSRRRTFIELIYDLMRFYFPKFVSISRCIICTSHECRKFSNDTCVMFGKFQITRLNSMRELDARGCHRCRQCASHLNGI